MSASRRSGAARVGGSFLDEFEYRFLLCGEGPQPLAVDGGRLGHGLPRRRIPLTELAAVLMHPSCSPEAKDAAWRLLVRNARGGSDGWLVGTVGVALPGLRNAAYRLRQLSAGDVEAVLVEQFHQALLTVDVQQPAIVNRLLNTAFSRARSQLDKREPDASGEVSFVPASRPPASPYDHPDFVLARAVRLGVLTAEQAELIGVIYLEKVSIREYADRIGRTYWQVYRERGRAVPRLVAAIEAGLLGDDPYTQVIAEATLTTAAEPGSAARRP